MKQKLIAEKTMILSVDKEQYLVSTLPEDIQNEIATYDRMKQNKIDREYDYEIIIHACAAKQEAIARMMKNYIQSLKSSISDEAVKDN